MEKEVERRVSGIDLRFDDMRKQVQKITQQRVSCLIHIRLSTVHTSFPLSTKSSTSIFPPVPIHRPSCSQCRMEIFQQRSYIYVVLISCGREVIIELLPAVKVATELQISLNYIKIFSL